ncbi:nucleoside hydrolase [Asticcacaulis solisilvae]|uniref:nucleoside hydrolase n=1 Tax=Asticcacaulis solisilvae TaxID=1217274 RepID=UPI003FD71E9D
MTEATRRGLIAGIAALIATTAAAKPQKPIPVIFHTDIGGDVDDTWALLFLLRRPELDLKLVVTEGSNAVYRGRLVAKLLTLAGRHDVAIAIGPDGRDDQAAQSAWIGDFKLSDYPKAVTTDGAKAMIDLIMASKTPVTIIGTGPATTTAEALKREPRIVKKARFVGMFGAVRQGYAPGSAPEAEYNVKCDPRALQTVLSAGWPCAITPLDTCGRFILNAADMAAVYASTDPFARAAVANSEAWLPNAPWMAKGFDLKQHSSILFDVVAVAMAYDLGALVMETLPIAVRDDGMTVIDPKGHRIQVATGWRDLDALRKSLVTTLTERPA